MNSVYFACTECRVYVDAGYRWAWAVLEEPGVVSQAHDVSVEAVFACAEYWNPPSQEGTRWLAERTLPAVRLFLEQHRAHRIIFGDHDEVIGTDDHGWMDWLEQGDSPEPSPRYFVETLGLRTWDDVIGWIMAHERPWWWEWRDMFEAVRIRFETQVLRGERAAPRTD